MPRRLRVYVCCDVIAVVTPRYAQPRVTLVMRDGNRHTCTCDQLEVGIEEDTVSVTVAGAGGGDRMVRWFNRADLLRSVEHILVPPYVLIAPDVDPADAVVALAAVAEHVNSMWLGTMGLSAPRSSEVWYPVYPVTVRIDGASATVDRPVAVVGGYTVVCVPMPLVKRVVVEVDDHRIEAEECLPIVLRGDRVADVVSSRRPVYRALRRRIAAMLSNYEYAASLLLA